MHGDHRSYLDDGNLYILRAYKNGLKNGEERNFYDNGRLKEIINYRFDERSGDYLKFYKKNGQIMERRYYKKGKQDEKKRIQYFENGKIKPN